MYTKIDKYLTKWLHSNGFECNAEYNTDFCYYINSKCINWAISINALSDNIYKSYVDTLGIKYNCDTFLLCFFHELGHHMTIEECSEEEWDETERIERECASKEIISADDHKEYFSSPIEYWATLWAIEYINENPQKIEKFWNELQPMLLEFVCST